VVLDACGCSGGLSSGWNPTCDEIYAFDTLAGIYLEAWFKHSTN
jgi:hypothetical protein